MPFTIIRQDITKMQVDAIVNAANTDLLMGGGVCGAIFQAAGASQLQMACHPLAPIKTGEAVITPGFNLPARYVIHAVGPIYLQEEKERCEQLLHNAYVNALKVAGENGCESIAFPLISSGIYEYPKADALQVATKAIRNFLEEQELDIYLVIFDKSALKVSEDLLGEVASYIDDHYVDLRAYDRRSSFSNVDERSILLDDSQIQQPMPEISPGKRGIPSSRPDKLSTTEAFPAAPKRFMDSVPSEFSVESVLYERIEEKADKLDDLLMNLDEPFSQTLLRLIDTKGLTDVEVYKAANIDRKLFSKIRIGKGYMPSKRTTLALAIGLRLSLDETDDLLERAGYALSRSQMFDVIVEYFISKGRYDIYEINEVLFSYDQQLLGS